MHLDHAIPVGIRQIERVSRRCHLIDTAFHPLHLVGDHHLSTRWVGGGGDTGIVDEDVELAPARHGGIDCSIEGGRIGDVEDGSVATHLIGHTLSGGEVEVVHHDLGAIGCEPTRECGAEARTCPGDEGHLSCQRVVCHRASPSFVSGRHPRAARCAHERPM